MVLPNLSFKTLEYTLKEVKHNEPDIYDGSRRKRKLHLVFEFCEMTVLNQLEKYPKGVPMQLTRTITWQTLQGQFNTLK